MLGAALTLLVVSNLLWWWRCSVQARETLHLSRFVGEQMREADALRAMLRQQHRVIQYVLQQMPVARGH